MKKYCLLLFLWTLASFSSASGLPAEHEVERLLLALKESVDTRDWPQAANLLSSMRGLDVKQPSESFYFEGLVKVRTSEFLKARKILEQYVIEVGRNGKFYQDALRLITEAENAEKRASKPENISNPSIELLSASKRDGYVKSLQALYLTQDPIKALVLQVNSLLSAHPYTGSRIKKSGVKEGVVYQVSVIHEGLTVKETSYLSGAPTLSASSIHVPGLDPFLGANCSHTEFACWLSHPSDKYKAWIKIDYDEMVLEELREAMSKLLQALQKEM